MPGRLRLKFSFRGPFRMSNALARGLKGLAADMPGIKSFETRPVTGSVIIYFDSRMGDVMGYLCVQ